MPAVNASPILLESNPPPVKKLCAWLIVSMMPQTSPWKVACTRMMASATLLMTHTSASK
jgi:hypothetical protein